MGGCISREGITADLESMKKAGLGGAFIFHVGQLPIESPVKYQSDEWWKLMRYASDESARLGLDLGFHNCPGWSSSGGPWIYDFGLRVTSSINWPGLTHPAISDALVSELDFTPTLLDLLGLPPMPKRLTASTNLY